MQLLNIYNRCIACTITNICKFYLLTYLFNTINAYCRRMQFAEYGIIILGINTIIMHAPYRKNNSLMAAFPHISTTNSGLVWFPMATRPWSSSRFQRILGYWCRYWSCSPCLPGFPVSSETSENQQILHTIKIQQVLLQLIFSIYMLSSYLCIVNICGLSIVWKFVQMKLCVLVSVYIKQRLCFHYLLGDLYSLVWSNYQNIRK